MGNLLHFLKDVFYYCQGNIRYMLYYSPYLHWLIHDHILEQIVWRIEIMNPLCFSQGSCVKCGCKTTALQMCNKPCDGNCYPAMLSKEAWEAVGKTLMRMQQKDPKLFKEVISYGK